MFATHITVTHYSTELLPCPENTQNPRIINNEERNPLLMVWWWCNFPLKSQANKFLPIYSLVFFLLLKTNFLFVRLLINSECKRIKEIKEGKETEKRKNPLFSSFWQRDFKENCVRRSEKKLTFMDPLAHPFLVSFLLILLCMLYWKLTEWFQIFHRHSKPKGTGSVPAALLPWGGFPYVFLFLFPCFSL